MYHDIHYKVINGKVNNFLPLLYMLYSYSLTPKTFVSTLVNIKKDNGGGMVYEETS